VARTCAQDPSSNAQCLLLRLHRRPVHPLQNRARPRSDGRAERARHGPFVQDCGNGNRRVLRRTREAVQCAPVRVLMAIGARIEQRSKAMTSWRAHGTWNSARQLWSISRTKTKNWRRFARKRSMTAQVGHTLRRLDDPYGADQHRRKYARTHARPLIITGSGSCCSIHRYRASSGFLRSI